VAPKFNFPEDYIILGSGLEPLFDTDFPTLSIKFSIFALESNRIIDKNRSTSVIGLMDDP